MTQDIIRMAREVESEVGFQWCVNFIELARFAALAQAAERNKLAQWMMAQGYATGHGDTMEDLLKELEWRDVAMSHMRQANAARATARIAIGHLQEMLNRARTATESYAADTAARDWLVSIGSEPE